MLPRLLLIVLLAPALAGCVTSLPDPVTGDVPAPDAATLQCVAGVCNFLATTTPETRQANELSLAVNPIDPLNIIATGKDYTPEHAADCVWSGIYVTKDGGLTWMNANVPDSPGDRLAGRGDATGTFSRYWCVTDPVVRFGPDGTAYWTVMPYQCDAVSGSKTGRGVLPTGGFNDWLWTCSSMYVLVSEDGGETWPIVREVAFAERLVHDKQWIAASPDGKRVLLCWDVGGEKSQITSIAPQAEPVADRPGIVCSVSNDKGMSWSAYKHVGFEGIFPWIDFGPDGRAWMTFVTGFASGDIMVSSSADGLTWEPPVRVSSFVNAPPGGEYGWPVLAGSDFRVIPLPSLAVDRSAGPHAGRVYVTWFDYARGNGNVFLASSANGESWTKPVQVHDDGASPHDQFMPAVSVGPDGIVDLSWYDRRDDVENHVFHVYYAYSKDGGANVSKNLRVTDVPSDEQYSHHQNGMIFLGDYRDSASSDGAAHLVWVDTRHEKADVFVATVLRD